MAPPTINSSKDLVAHYQKYVSIIGDAATTAADLAPYFADEIQVDDKTITVAEFRAIVPPGTEVRADRFVADIQERTLAVRVKIHVPSMNLKMTEHVFYELNEEWRIFKVVRLYALEGNEVPVGN